VELRKNDRVQEANVGVQEAIASLFSSSKSSNDKVCDLLMVWPKNGQF